jgi:putative transposase
MILIGWWLNSNGFACLLMGRLIYETSARLYLEMPYYRLFYHFVWATKDRLPLITPDNRDTLHSCMAAKVIELRGIVHAIGGMTDHVHLVATVPPAVALSTFVGQIKGSASHLASHSQSPHYEPFAWQQEYGVVTITERHLPVVVRYVLNQEEHHRQNTLRKKLETFE